MKIVKNGLFMVIAFVFSLGLASSALALEAGVSAETSVNVTRSSDTSRDGMYTKSTTTTEVRTTSERNESDQMKASSEVRASTTRSNDNSTTTVRSEISIDHESRVATFIRNLLNIANRNPSIGVEVRAIAREQGDSSTTTAESINRIEARNSFRTFLIGSDYRNLGMIRAELARADNRIERLRVIASLTVSAEVRAELNVEIKSLVDDRTKVMAFVEANENKFSIFGWFVRMFVR